LQFNLVVEKSCRASKSIQLTNVYYTLDCAQPGCNKRTNLRVCSACNATRCCSKVCKVADCAVHCDKCKELKGSKAGSARVYILANSNQIEETMTAKMLACLLLCYMLGLNTQPVCTHGKLRHVFSAVRRCTICKDSSRTLSTGPSVYQ
jgi:hypothetical protein